MSKKIEEAFNDCFERLLLGESLESCVSRYPELAGELDSMLRTTFDVKRRAYPIQPRPEFKYWGRVRFQNVQEGIARDRAAHKTPSFNLRRNLAITMAALLVFVMASTGTAAASSDALPDQPLYGVKLAVEQVQITLTPSDTDKAELYANLAEKRAQEIAVMATQGKADKVESTTTRMYYQLDQAEQLLIKSETAVASTGWVTAPTAPATTATTPPSTTSTSPTVPSQGTAALTAPADQGKTATSNETTVKSLTTERNFNNVNKARTSINASAVKSLAVLQNALDKAPASVKPNLSQIIERTKTTNERINARPFVNPNLKPVTPGTKLNDDKDDDKTGTDRRSPLIIPNKKKVIPPPVNQRLDKNDQGSDSGQPGASFHTDGQDRYASTGATANTGTGTQVKSAGVTTAITPVTQTPSGALLPKTTTTLSSTTFNNTTVNTTTTNTQRTTSTVTVDGSVTNRIIVK